jgi:hypothetical protein
MSSTGEPSFLHPQPGADQLPEKELKVILSGLCDELTVAAPAETRGAARPGDRGLRAQVSVDNLLCGPSYPQDHTGDARDHVTVDDEIEESLVESLRVRPRGATN